MSCGVVKLDMPEDKYSRAKADRAKYGDAIVASPSTKKLVVAGPGTGKTHLFKRVLAGKQKTITLSFVNSLVADLALELCGLSEVKTLHGFARGTLGKAGTIRIYPRLSEVIREDASILLGEDVDFDRLFNNRDDGNSHVRFYKERKDYYRHYGYADVVFAVVKAFEAKREKIPAYEQVIVDEFQDFNKLEVSLIDLLAERSPVLLAGDDDQALYAFKDASPDHIRNLHARPEHGFSAFNLPYCSRCTRVIVEASNDVIKAAIASGRLSGRIEKPYIYFEDEDKDKESDQYPRIIHARLQAAQIPWFIEKKMGEIAQETKKSFQALVISPTKVQSKTIVAALREKGLKNIDLLNRKEEVVPTLLEGLKLMLEVGEEFGNLGWRIAARYVLKEAEFAAALRKSTEKAAGEFHKLISRSAKRELGELSKTIRALRDGRAVADEAVDSLFTKIGVDARELAKLHLKEEIEDDWQRGGNPSIRTIPVKATTIQSSKGLAADYVFVTHFDDRYVIKDRDKTKISDHDICSFLVALTRAKKKVFLVSSNPKIIPTFRTWIDGDRIEEVTFQGKG